MGPTGKCCQQTCSWQVSVLARYQAHVILVSTKPEPCLLCMRKPHNFYFCYIKVKHTYSAVKLLTNKLVQEIPFGL